MGSSALYILILLVGLCASMKFVVNRDTINVVELGKSTYINCKTNAQNTKVSLWKINGNKRIKVVAGRNVHVMNEGLYFFAHIFARDFGEYECKAVRFGNAIRRKVHIKLNTTTVLLMRPIRATIEVLPGSTFTLTCESNNIRSDIITWRFNHVKQTPSHSIKEYYSRTGIKISKLTVHNAMYGFTGVYECQRRPHRIGQAYLSKKILVKVVVPKGPSFNNPYDQDNITVKEGQSKLLKCVANGFPEPTVTWEKDGNPLKTCTHFGSCDGMAYKQTKEGLEIVSASFNKDNGTFTCVARNLAGTQLKTFEVNVQVAPDLSSSHLSVGVTDNKPHNITCTDGKGNPPAKFEWKVSLLWNNNIRTAWTEIKPKQYYSKDGRSSTITVPSIFRYVEYKCIAKNPVGNDSHVITFTRIH